MTGNDDGTLYHLSDDVFDELYSMSTKVLLDKKRYIYNKMIEDLNKDEKS